jgi:sensor c-di-GMP phosphodiesterase-like protein
MTATRLQPAAARPDLWGVLRGTMSNPDHIGDALQRMVAHYQPIVDLNTGEVIGAETLVRFAEPDGALRSPEGLIERIEECPSHLDALMASLFGLIARDIAPILERHPRFYISLNVPPVIVGSGVLKRIVESVGLVQHVHRLVCELTERQALSDVGRQALAEARRLGVRVAMDDFGTGQSGLKQLIGLDLDILKIDKSQVDPLMKDPTADRLLRGVVALASALRVKLVAEGVETREQAFFLRAAGVDAGQGWLWSKAIPAGQLEHIIQVGFPQQRVWQTLSTPGGPAGTAS